jgi:hypothetical protein
MFQRKIMRRAASSLLILAGIAATPLPGVLTVTAVQAAEQKSEAEKKNIEEYIRLVRRDLRQDKRELIAEAMNLDQSEAAVFWPVYDRYEADLRKLGDEKLALIKDYSDNYKTMNDAKAGELTRKAIDLDIRRTSLLQQYLPEFQKALTNRRAAQFYQVEMPMLKLVDLQIASQLPMMP